MSRVLAVTVGLIGCLIGFATAAPGHAAAPAATTQAVCTEYPPRSVAQLQCYLNHALDPANYPPLPVDGVFGPRTRAHLMAFQRCAGLPVDGVPGPQTWESLRYWANSGTYVC